MAKRTAGLAEHKATPAAELAAMAPQEILNTIVEQGIRPRDDEATSHGLELIQKFAEELVKRDGKTTPASVTKAITTWISELDQLLSDQLNEILHHPEFQKLEGAWRGLEYLVSRTETGESMSIRVLNATKRELLQDFEAATEFTESALWKKIYSSEFDTFGGDPYGLLIGDFEFTRHPEDIGLLDHVSKVAAAAHAPFLSAAGADMFGMETF